MIKLVKELNRILDPLQPWKRWLQLLSGTVLFMNCTFMLHFTTLLIELASMHDSVKVEVSNRYQTIDISRKSMIVLTPGAKSKSLLLEVPLVPLTCAA